MESDFRKKFWALLIVGVLCVVSTTLWAADIYGKIRGTVTDPSGAVVANATITVTNPATNMEYKAVSGSGGEYEVLQLPVGVYNMKVQAAGFRSFAVSGIKLSVDQVYLQEIKLQVGQASETVEVKANAVQVDTTNIQLSSVINSQQMLDLPLIGRNWVQLQSLLPGVQAGSDRFGTFSTNGAQSQQNSFLINGNDSNDLPLNTPLYTPSVDAIGEFSFATSSLNPEYGRNSGAVLSATIKNGTNSFHGSVFEFYRDTFLNLANFFQKTTAKGGGVPVFHQNVYGGTIGGPIWKNKAFFFASYQGIRARQPQVNANVVLSAAERTGDFSSTLTPAFLAANGFNVIPGTIGARLGGFNAACVGGNTWQQCFTATGGLIPGGTLGMDPIALALMNSFVPLPNGPGNTFSFGAVTTQPRTHQLITREDFTLSSKDQLWGAFTYSHAPALQDLPFTGASLPGFGSQQGTDVRQFTVAWTHTFSPTTLNELRVGYTRLNFQTVFPQKPVLPASVGFAINPQLPAEAGLPVIAVNGGGLAATSGSGSGFTLGFSNNGPQPRIDETRQISDNFTKIVGKHSFKFGWNGSKFNVNNPFAFENAGTYTFGGDPTSTNFSSGNAFVDYLLGNPDGYSQSTNAVINAQAWESYAYAQDVWKATPSLTVTLGVGWQVDTPLYQEQFNKQGIICFIGGQQSKVFPNNGLFYSNPAATGPPIGINYPGDPGCNTAGGAKIGWHNLGPRVGFAYSPDLGRISGGKSNKLVIRGGIGIYYNRSEEEAALQDLGDAPYGLTSSGATDFGTCGGGFSCTPAFANPFQDIDTGTVFGNKFPATFAKPGAVVNYHTFTPLVMSHFSPDFKIPHSINYNLTVQRELPGNVVLTLSYVGAQGRNLQTTIHQNPITQAGHDACFLSAVCKSAGNRPFQELLFPQHTQFGATGLLTDPNGLNAVTAADVVASRGKSSYNSLQVSATKGYSHGLLFQASYTYSKSLDDASSFEASGFGGANRGYNQYFPALNKGPSVFDARHRFVFSPVYQFPAIKHGIPDVIGKGWKLSGIFTAASGFSFDTRDSAGRSLWCAFTFYVCPDAPRLLNVVPYVEQDPRKDNTAICGSRSCWFNPTAFGRETIGSFDGVSRNKFHGPGINNVDFALEKDIFFQPSNEKRYLELRIEFFNAFNHTQFALPSGRVSLGTAGRITSASAARQIQLAAKIYF